MAIDVSELQFLLEVLGITGGGGGGSSDGYKTITTDSDPVIANGPESTLAIEGQGFIQTLGSEAPDRIIIDGTSLLPKSAGALNALTGDLYLGSNNIVTDGLVDGKDVSSLPESLDELTDVNLGGTPNNNDVLLYSGGQWVASPSSGIGVTDHGALTGLGDDDHPQYHTDGRALTWLGTRSTTDLPEGTNLYYTEARVSANADVVAALAGIHDPVTVTDTATVDLTLTGQDISAAVIPGGISHTAITDIGTNTHAQIDTFIAGISGAANRIAIFSGTQSIGTDADVVWDATNDHFGIGTPSPAAELHVYGNKAANVRIRVENDSPDGPGDILMLGSNTEFLMRSYGASQTGTIAGINVAGSVLLRGGGSSAPTSILFGQAAANPIYFLTNNVVAMSIDGSQRVGVGLAAPDQRFHIQENANANVLGKVDNQNAGASAAAVWQARSENVFAHFTAHSSGSSATRGGVSTADAAEVYAFGGESALLVGVQSDVPVVWHQNNLEVMRINTGGNIGIGTNSPDYSLHVFGDRIQLEDGFFSSRVDDGSTDRNANFQYWDNTGTGAGLNTGSSAFMWSSRGTQPSPSALSTGDESGKIRFYSRATAGWTLGAQLQTYVGTAGTNNATGFSIFLHDGTGAFDNIAEKFRIAPNGATTIPTGGLTVGSLTHFNTYFAMDGRELGGTPQFATIAGSSGSDYGWISAWNESGVRQWILNFGDRSQGNNFQVYSDTASNYVFSIRPNGDVGIGPNTDAPLNNLDVNGNMVIGTGYAQTNTAPANGLLVEGFVGIGSTNPAVRLVVDGVGGIDSMIQARRNNADFGARIYVTSADAGVLALSADGAASDGVFISGDDGVNSYINSLAVGIGTTSPDTKLDIQNNANSLTSVKLQNQTAGTAALAAYQVESDSANGALSAYSSTNSTTFGTLAAADSVVLRTSSAKPASRMILSTGTNVPMHFLVNDAEVMRLNTVGNIITYGASFLANDVVNEEYIGLRSIGDHDMFLRYDSSFGGESNVYRIRLGGNSTPGAWALGWFENASTMFATQTGVMFGASDAPVNTVDVEGAVAIGASFAGTSTAPTNGLLVEGDVNIGTATLAGKLTVDDSLNGTVGMYIKNANSGTSGNTAYQVFNNLNNSVSLQAASSTRSFSIDGESLANAVGLYTTGTPSKLFVGTQSSAPAHFIVNNQIVMTLETNQDVSIGSNFLWDEDLALLQIGSTFSQTPSVAGIWSEGRVFTNSFFQFIGENNADGHGFRGWSYDNTGAAGGDNSFVSLQMHSARGTNASFSALSNGDVLGQIEMQGRELNGWTRAVRIRGVAETVGTDITADLIFELGDGTTFLPSEVMKLKGGTGRLGIGVSNPSETLELVGALKIGNATNTDDGTIRYTGTDFEGRVSGAWQSLTASGGSGSPGGANTQVQFNDSSSFGGSSDFTWDGSSVAATNFTLSSGGIFRTNGNDDNHGIINIVGPGTTWNSVTDFDGPVLFGFGKSGLGTRNSGVSENLALTWDQSTNVTFYGNLNISTDQQSIQFPQVTGTPVPMIYMFDGGTSNADRMVIAHSPAFSTWGLEYEDSGDIFYFRSSSAQNVAIVLQTGFVGIGPNAASNPTDQLDVDGNIVHTGQVYQDSVVTTNSAPAGVTIDWDNGNSQILNLGTATLGNVNITFTNGRTGASYVLKIIQHASSAKTVGWNAGVLWPGGTAPVISTGASAVDIISLWYDGTNWYGTFVQDMQ